MYVRLICFSDSELIELYYNTILLVMYISLLESQMEDQSPL